MIVNDLRKKLVRGGFGSVAIKLAHVLLAMGVSVTLARALGAGGFGIYAYVFAWVSVLSIPAKFGLPQLAIREIARARVLGDPGRVAALLAWVSRLATLLSVVVSAAIVVFAAFFPHGLSSNEVYTLYWGAVALPLIAIGDVKGAVLRGFERVLLGQLATHVIRPGVLVLLAAGAWYYSSGAFGPHDAMAVHAAAALVALFWVGWVVMGIAPPSIQAKALNAGEKRYWLRSLLPLGLISSMHVLNYHVDVLVLGLLSPKEEVGIYRAVLQAATFVLFGLQSMNMLVAPYFARFRASGDAVRLQKLVTWSARVSLALAAPITIVFAFYGGSLLELLFGTEFHRGHFALLILSVGQFVSAFFGSVGFLLNMSGYEGSTARVMGIATLINLILDVLLIPPFGIIGAAIATASSIVFWNVLLWHVARTRLGVNSVAL